MASLWLDTLGETITPRAPLPGPRTFDVAIVGGDFTGLWTAIELRKRDPHLRIAIIEAHHAGFGASGRNGGWCSAILPMDLGAIEARSDRSGAIALAKAMEDTVAEVGRASAEYGIDCDFAHDGYLHVARTKAQVKRLHAHIAQSAPYGVGDERWLGRSEANELLVVPNTLGAVFTPHCAAIHPAKLVRGLARVAVAKGIELFEQTKVWSIDDRHIQTEHGTVSADVVVRATEGFTSSLAGAKRDIIPIYSLMVATEPIDDAIWDQIGWRTRFTFNDARNLIVYAQRTADGRIALGGRGPMYHWGSKTEPAYDNDDLTHTRLKAAIIELFPMLADVLITNAWGGPVGVPRDWFSSVGYDKESGYAWAGGYVGDGVATTNLAGRTLADLIVGHDTDLTALPWVNHRSRRWEPEPLRWIGVNAMVKLNASMDTAEDAGRHARLRHRLVDAFIG